MMCLIMPQTIMKISFFAFNNNMSCCIWCLTPFVAELSIICYAGKPPKLVGDWCVGPRSRKTNAAGGCAPILCSLGFVTGSQSLGEVSKPN